MSREATSLQGLGPPLGSVWKSARQREELVRQALCARHLYVRDRHYLVHEGAVKIIDENTGRVMAGPFLGARSASDDRDQGEL